MEKNEQTEINEVAILSETQGKPEQEKSEREQTENEVNGDEKEKVSLGKFKDVNSLLNAYNSLQAEFTKRCQRLKELEQNATVDKLNPTDVVATVEEKPTSITEEEKEQILKDYLKGLVSRKPQAVIMDNGVPVTAPVNRPKTICEAGILAKEIFN